MRTKILMITSLFVCLALFFSLAAIATATAERAVDSRLRGNDRVVRGKQANWPLSESGAGQKNRPDVGFPHTAGGLLIISFAMGSALVTAGLALKVFFSHRR